MRYYAALHQPVSFAYNTRVRVPIKVSLARILLSSFCMTLNNSGLATVADRALTNTSFAVVRRKPRKDNQPPMTSENTLSTNVQDLWHQTGTYRFTVSLANAEQRQMCVPQLSDIPICLMRGLQNPNTVYATCVCHSFVLFLLELYPLRSCRVR